MTGSATRHTKIATVIATAGYVGFIPIASGTFGSAVGVAVYAMLPSDNRVVIETALLVVLFIAGLWSADRVERDLGKDPHAVVIDEVVGMLVTVAFLDLTVTGIVVAFLLFRLLDVIKPFPAGRLEHLHGGAGIMLDDVMAGVYANLLLRGLIILLPVRLVS